MEYIFHTSCVLLSALFFSVLKSLTWLYSSIEEISRYIANGCRDSDLVLCQ